MHAGQVRLRDDLPRPQPGAGEVLIRVRRAGICNTDLEIMRGYAPFDGILGHEFVGEVLGGPAELDGRRVVGEISVACGSCRRCDNDEPKHCTQRRVLGIRGLDGAFAEYLVLPASNLHVVPDSVSDLEAAFVEPLAAAQHVDQQAGIRKSDNVVVVGDGKLGQLVARALAPGAARVTVLGRHQRKLELLAKLGITTSTDVRQVGQGFDVAVDCTGQPEGFETARSLLRAGGTLVLKSTYAGRLNVDASALVVDEIRIVGSRCGAFAPAIEALASGGMAVAPLLDATYPIERGIDALEHAARRGTLKIQLQMSA